MAAFRDKDAIVYRSQRWSYAQFAARVNQLANALKNRGLQKGDRVVFLCPNIPPLLEAHFGVPASGGVLVAINIRLSAKDICYILNNCGARLLFVDTKLSHLVASVRDKLETVEEIINIVDTLADAPGEKLPGTDYETFLTTGNPDLLPSTLTDENEPISINYTSGVGCVRNAPRRRVIYTHRGAYLNALGEALELGMNNRSIYLWTLPMFHCNGWCFTWGVVAVGGTHICMRKFFPNTVVSLIMNEGVISSAVN